MFISPFTPLFFIDHRSDGLDSKYIQTFAPTDKILIEIICERNYEEGDWCLYSEPEHKLIDVIDYQWWNFNDNQELHFAVLSPSPGLYSLEVMGKCSEVFRVTDDPLILKNTTLIQYSMNNNRHRADGLFFIDNMQHFFDFRVPGGFKDSNWTFSVESEQFTTPQSDIVQLYGLDSTQKKFTLGNSEGCPIWFGELLNRILCCSYVYFDGERYARKDTAAPEVTAVLEGVNSFVFSQNLQKITNIDPQLMLNHQAIMRRVITIDDDGAYSYNYRTSNTNINRLIK